MSMRQRNFDNREVSSSGRVINRSNKRPKRKINKKKLIAPIISCVVMVIFFIVYIIVKISTANQSEQVQQVQELKDNYLENAYGFFDSCIGVYIDGVLEGIDLSDYLDQAFSDMAKGYTKYAIKSSIRRNEIVTEIYGLDENEQESYITTLIVNETGSYANSTQFYRMSETAETLDDVTEYYTYLMHDANHIKMDYTGFQNGTELMRFILNFLGKISQDNKYEMAKSDGSYSIMVEGDSVPQLGGDGIISKIIEGGTEDFISTCSLEGEYPSRILNFGIQRGDIIFQGTATEDITLEHYGMVYSVSTKTLNNAISGLTSIQNAIDNMNENAERDEIEEEAKKLLERNYE